MNELDTVPPLPQQANKLLQCCCVSGTSAPETGNSRSASRSGINNIEERFLINRECFQLPTCHGSIKKWLSEVRTLSKIGRVSLYRLATCYEVVSVKVRDSNTVKHAICLTFIDEAKCYDEKTARTMKDEHRKYVAQRLSGIGRWAWESTTGSASLSAGSLSESLNLNRCMAVPGCATFTVPSPSRALTTIGSEIKTQKCL